MVKIKSHDTKEEVMKTIKELEAEKLENCKSSKELTKEELGEVFEHIRKDNLTWNFKDIELNAKTEAL